MRRDDGVKHPAKFLEAGGGNDNGIAPAIGILGDTQKPAPGIFPEIENKILSLDSDVFTFQDRVHR